MLWSAHPVSSIAKVVYLAVTAVVFALGVIAAVLTFRDNAAWVQIVLWLPGVDQLLFAPRRYEVNLGALLAGWAVSIGVLALFVVRAPFLIRAAALRRRRVRELEREVLELRTLPLRQEEEDAALATEAHLRDVGKKVMTQSLGLDAPASDGSQRR